MSIEIGPIVGGISVDDRGSVRFVNAFNFDGVKRFYQVENNHRGSIRAWHGHQREGKYVYVPRGSILIGAMDLSKIGKEFPEKPLQFVLSDKRPTMLWIPPGYANGFMSLEEDTIVMFYSTATISESAADDIRFQYDRWNIWQPNYR